MINAARRVRKIATIDCQLGQVSVRPQLDCHWADFNWIWCMRIFRKSVEKIKISLNSDKNNGYFTWRHTYCYGLSCWIAHRTRNVSAQCYTENRNTLCAQRIISEKSCRLCDNVEKYGTAGHATDGNIMRHAHFASWITNATHTNSE